MDNEKINKKDIKSVSEWLNSTVDNLHIEYIKESFADYEKQAKEMYDSYEEFPLDAKRTNKILKLIKNGEAVFPVYVEKSDTSNFVMEGRHRMVAFYLIGFKEITVARVSLKVENKKKNKM